ncbi:MAG: hypothetical protein QM820_21025 [Minicystis sp.]
MHRFLITLLSSLLVGCAFDAGEPDLDPTGVSRSAFETTNALTANALTANALYPSALTAGVLAGGPLALDALPPGARAAIQGPDAAANLSRQLLRYVVGCALDSTQSFSFTWTDDTGGQHAETYPGGLGLDPAWATRPLAASERGWVSACLASRVNWYGVSVVISARGAHPELAEPAPGELAAYPMEEGAFWGDLFGDTPSAFTCYRGPNVDHSRARYRTCAAGHLRADGGVDECGILHIVGDCATYCQGLAAGVYHPSCQSEIGVAATATDQVVTVFLP